jgi:hypothetical protein
LFNFVLATDLLVSLTILFTDIVDKTASFVARNGPEFEARIRQNEIGNPKFNFLNFGDPYHAYYQYKVKDFREGRGESCAYSHTGFNVVKVTGLGTESVSVVKPIVAYFSFFHLGPELIFLHYVNCKQDIFCASVV